MHTEILFAGLVSSTASSDSITAALVDSAGRLGALNLAKYEELAVFVQLKTLSGGSSPTIQVVAQTGDGQTGVNQDWESLFTPPAAWTSAPSHNFASVEGTSLGNTGRFSWTITGTPGACTFYVTIIGKYTE